MQLVNRLLQIVKKTALVVALLAIYSTAVVLLYENFLRPVLFPPSDYAEKITDPTEKTPVPTPAPIPSSEPSPVPTMAETNANQTQNQPPNDIAPESPTALMIPVVGIKREQLQDTFNDARSEGRVHNAIDIMAAQGTPVVACSDGEIAKFFDSERGGTTIYQYSADRRFVYYYAHLQKRADGIREKDFVKRGTVIGYVGDTGNSGAGNFHLHFTVTVLADGQRYWEGSDINPFPLLRNGFEAN